jgi:hypothetical protein
MIELVFFGLLPTEINFGISTLVPADAISHVVVRHLISVEALGV